MWDRNFFLTFGSSIFRPTKVPKLKMCTWPQNMAMRQYSTRIEFCWLVEFAPLMNFLPSYKLLTSSWDLSALIANFVRHANQSMDFKIIPNLNFQSNVNIKPIQDLMFQPNLSKSLPKSFRIQSRHSVSLSTIRLTWMPTWLKSIWRKLLWTLKSTKTLNKISSKSLTILMASQKTKSYKACSLSDTKPKAVTMIPNLKSNLQSENSSG